VSSQPSGIRVTDSFSLGLGVGVVLILAVVSGVMQNSAQIWAEGVLLVGAAALAPFILRRLLWSKLGGARVTLLVGGWGVAVWAAVSAFAHLGDGPWQQAVFGWFGRGTGVLAYVAAAILLTAGMVLTRVEIWRVLYCVVAAGALSALATVIQSASGNSGSRDGAPGLMGNADFNGALCGLACGLALLLIVRFANGPRWCVVLLALIATFCAAGAVLSRSWQGGITAIVAVAVGMSIYSYSRRFWLGLGVSVAVLAAVIVLGALVFAGVVVLPGAVVDARLIYWQTALATIKNVPLTGMGPDAFAEAVAQFRPMDYLTVRDPSHHVSAAHSVPLQLGATLGVPALIFWALGVGAVAFALFRALRARVVAASVVAAVVGAWAAYLAQSLISVDQLALLAIGWTLAGLVMAAVAPMSTEIPSDVAPWRFAVACVGAAAAVVMVLPEGLAISRALHASTSAQTSAAMTSSWTPCSLRSSLAQTAFAAPVRVFAAAYDLDPRCPGVGDAYASTLLNNGQPAQAKTTVEQVIAYDPLDLTAWILLGIADARLGDVAGAKAAQSQARAIARYGSRLAYEPQLRLLSREIRKAESAR